MSNDQQKHDDLTAILNEIYADTLPTTDRMDLENRGRSQETTSYLSFEQDDEEPIAQTAQFEVGEEDVRTFESSSNTVEMPGTSTRVIDVAESDTEKKASDKEDEEYEVRGLYEEGMGYLKALIYLVCVLAVSLLLAWPIRVAIVDVTGIGRSTMNIDVRVPEGASTQDVAELLKDEGIIESPLFFRVFCRLMKADGSFHPGVHTVSANMGYAGIADGLQTLEMRETVTVTIREGSTIDAIAKQMEESGVCTSKEFYTALTTISYDDYDFIAELTAEERAGRAYLLEGYLFPDTYEFYMDGAAETAIRTMLDNFAVRVDADTRASIKASGKTLNEVLILASIAQMEAGEDEDMPRVMRVVRNRLENTGAFPCLQLDSTEDYMLNLPSKITVADTDYNTYVRSGLPVGAICNPGLAAINAALNPSQEPDIMECFYFASIVSTGETEFFETFDEHEAWCIEHGVGMYE